MVIRGALGFCELCENIRFDGMFEEVVRKQDMVNVVGASSGLKGWRESGEV